MKFDNQEIKAEVPVYVGTITGGESVGSEYGVVFLTTRDNAEELADILVNKTIDMAPKGYRKTLKNGNVVVLDSTDFWKEMGDHLVGNISDYGDKSNPYEIYGLKVQIWKR